MCGIAGILASGQWKTAPEVCADVAAMTDRLAHRGPDDSGLYSKPAGDGMIALGHRRLSILDLGGGHQPWIENADHCTEHSINCGSDHHFEHDLALVYNGEIYNYPTLKADLQRKGYRFQTTCDTEILLPLYREYGSQFVNQLQGMFAFALWDSRTRELILARDHVGKKPLYYTFDRDRLIFGSELKAILTAEPDLATDLDPEAIDLYFTLQYIPAPWTIYSNVWKLAPGEVMTFRMEAAEGTAAVVAGKSTVIVRRSTAVYPVPGGSIIAGPSQLSELQNCQAGDLSYDQAKAQLRSTLTQAVSDRMISDVPLGAFLSGGIDSTIIVGLMQSISSRPVKTFSIGFDDPAFDETSYARMAAEFLGTDHTEFRVTPDQLGIFMTLVDSFDEPFADSSALPTWYVSSLARKDVTVALTGDGGDELFLGYDRYKAVQIGSWADAFCPHWLRQAIGSAVTAVVPGNLRQGSIFRKGRRFAECLAMSPLERYLDWICYFNYTKRHQLYNTDFDNRLNSCMRTNGIVTSPALEYFQNILATRTGCVSGHASGNVFGCVSGNTSGRTTGNRSLRLSARDIGWLDFQTYLPEDLLVKVDRTSMNVSLECRCPFLDRQVAELVARFPQSWSLSGGVLGTRYTKRILIDTFSDLLPPAIQTRPKQGFGVPLRKWFMSGPLRDRAEVLFRSEAFRQSGIFRPDAGTDLLAEHLSGKFDHGLRLWALLFFAMFLEKNR